ncbi:MAG TPA: helix-turn-helix domain-containing protein [Myxococcaceae bacterium]|nr:helix-turn-helix domain-containing protein [Myxococcaceae bacterium]
MEVEGNDQGRRKMLGNTHQPESVDILTVNEAANLLRVNRKTLYEVIRLTRPRWAIRFGRTIRVSRTALLEAFRGKGGPALGD